MLDNNSFDQFKSLRNLLKFFYNSKIFPKVGIELEFYLEDVNILSKIENIIKSYDNLVKIKPEIGSNQYEIVFPPSINILKYIELVETSRNILLENNCALEVIYKEDHLPNALHLNLNFLKENQRNLFERIGNNYNLPLKQAIGGMCQLMPECLCFFLPKAEDYQRIKRFDPKNISWGANNRTTSLRLPENIPENLRIEQRLISPKSDLTAVILVSLLSAYYGISNKVKPPEKIYGLAGQERNVKPLPSSLQEALSIYHDNLTLKNLIKDFS